MSKEQEQVGTVSKAGDDGAVEMGGALKGAHDEGEIRASLESSCQNKSLDQLQRQTAVVHGSE